MWPLWRSCSAARRRRSRASRPTPEEARSSRIGAASAPRPALTSAAARASWRARRPASPGAGPEREREAVELGRAVERQRGGGVPGGALGEEGRPRRVAGALVVGGEQLGVGARLLLHGGEAEVGAAERLRIQALHHQLPDPIVEGLGEVAGAEAPAPDEVLRTQDRERGVGGSDAGGAGAGPLLDRPRRHRHRLEEAPGVGREAVDPRPEHALQRHARHGPSGRDRAHQLGDEEGAAVGLPGDGRRQRLVRAGAAEEGAGQGGGLVVGEAAHLDDLAVHRREGAERAEELALVDLVAPVAGEEQQRGRVGRGEQGGHQLGAVDVAPLEVVEVEDQRPPPGQVVEEVPERGEGAAARLHGVAGGRVVALGVLVDHGHLVEHGEDAGEVPDLGGDHRRRRPRRGGDRGGGRARPRGCPTPCRARSPARSSARRGRARPPSATPRRGSARPAPTCRGPTGPARPPSRPAPCPRRRRPRRAPRAPGPAPRRAPPARRPPRRPRWPRCPAGPAPRPRRGAWRGPSAADRRRARRDRRGGRGRPRPRAPPAGRSASARASGGRSLGRGGAR